MGLVFASAMATATFGVDAGDAGVASAMVNTMQQIGGSIGTALLSTLAASAVADRLAEAATRPDAALAAQAAVHGYTTAFWWAAGIFAVGGVICSALLTRRSLEVAQERRASRRSRTAGGEPARRHGREGRMAPLPAATLSARDARHGRGGGGQTGVPSGPSAWRFRRGRMMSGARRAVAAVALGDATQLGVTRVDRLRR